MKFCWLYTLYNCLAKQISLHSICGTRHLGIGPCLQVFSNSGKGCLWMMTALNCRASVAGHALLKSPKLTSATLTLKLEQYTENNTAPVHKWCAHLWGFAFFSISRTWIGRINIFQMAIIPKATYTMPIKQRHFSQRQRRILKSLWNYRRL